MTKTQRTEQQKRLDGIYLDPKRIDNAIALQKKIEAAKAKALDPKTPGDAVVLTLTHENILAMGEEMPTPEQRLEAKKKTIIAADMAMTKAKDELDTLMKAGWMTFDSYLTAVEAIEEAQAQVALIFWNKEKEGR